MRFTHPHNSRTVIPRRQRPWRIPAQLPILGLFLLAALSPRIARASIPDLATTARPFEDYSLSQPTSPLAEIEQREAGRVACGAFCGEPLDLALDGRLGSGKASVDTQDAWGVFRNPEMKGLGASKNRFAFTGYVFDRETGLYYAKARFYDPTVGRFTSQDSFLGDIERPPSLHRYLYAHARPTFWTHPTGRSPQDDKAEFWSMVGGMGLDPATPAQRQAVDRARLEADARAGEMLIDTVTVRFSGGVQRAQAEGRLGTQANVLQAGAEGMVTTVPGVEAAVDAYSNTQGIGGIAGAVAKEVFAITDFRAALDSHRDVGERAVAGLRGAAKLAALSYAAKKITVGVVVETRTGVAIVPMSGDGPHEGADLLDDSLRMVGQPQPTRFIDDVRIVDRRTGSVLQGTVDLKPTLERVASGERFPHRNDGAIFQNRPLPGRSAPGLPAQPAGYYREYVHPTPGVRGPGPQRIVVGQGGDTYYTPDHYQTFIPVKPQ